MCKVQQLAQDASFLIFLETNNLFAITTDIRFFRYALGEVVLY